jgi:DNA-binding beta-propeller fold protein YncE
MNFPRCAQNLRVTATLAMLALLMCLSSLAAAQKNLVYINANIPVDGQNAIIVLQNDGAGNLSPITGSPFPTLGTGVAGTGDPTQDKQWDSDGEVVTDPTGKILLAVNGHSNNLSGFIINADGSLTLQASSPVSSGGIQPASIGLMPNALGNGNSLAVIVNKNGDPFQINSDLPSYTTFQVSQRGALRLNAGSSYPLADKSYPGMALVPPTGRAAFFGVEFMGQTLGAYTLNRQGIITHINSLTPPGATPFVLGAAAHPKVRGIYTGIPPQHQVAVFSYDSSMTLTYLNEVQDTGIALCWMWINKAGTRLYTVETGSGSVSVFDTTNSKTPVLIEHLTVQGTAPLPAHVRLDPTEKFLYVLDRNRLLHVFDVAVDGTIAENHTPYDLGLADGTVPLGLSTLMK